MRLAALEQENAQLQEAIATLQDAQARAHREAAILPDKSGGAPGTEPERPGGAGTSRRALLRTTAGAAVAAFVASTVLERESDIALALGNPVSIPSAVAGALNLAYPIRVVDTRIGLGGVRLGARQTLIVQVAGSNRVPRNAVGVVANMVAAAVANSNGNLVVYPAGLPVPETSNINYWGTPDNAISTLVVCALGTGRRAGLLAILNQGDGSVDVVLDLFGYIGGHIPATV